MENNIYFRVQDFKKESLGYKMYTLTLEKTTYYEKDEIKKAIKHFKKRKSNNITMCCVEYLENAPYVKIIECSGIRHLVDIAYYKYNGTIIDFSKEHNEEIKECLDFYDFDIRYYI